jgi:YbbR domain-containing protein
MAYNPFRQFWLKLLAVLIAGGLWFVVAGEHVVERSLRVPLEFRNVPEGTEIVGDPPATVDVRVRGSSGVLTRLEPGNVIVVLDMTEARGGSRLFHLRAEQVERPFGVDVVQIQPPTLSLELQATARKRVPVVPALEGEPARGFMVRAVRSDPETVEVVGPEEHVRQVNQATTEPVPITGATSYVRDVVTIGLVRSTVRLRQPQNANVTVEIVPANAEPKSSNP